MPVVGQTLEYGPVVTVPYEGPPTQSQNVKRTVDIIQWSSNTGNFKDPTLQTFRVIKTHGYYGEISGTRYKNNVIQSSVTSGYISSGPTMPTTDAAPVFASLNDMNLQKVMSQMRNGGNLAVDLAESSQVIRMVKNATSLRQLVTEFARALKKDTARSWRGLDRSVRRSNVIQKNNTRSSRATAPLKWRYQGIAKSIKKKNVGLTRGQKTLDYATGKWLEYSYGWLPLVHSIHDAVETLDRFYANRYVRVKVRSSLARPMTFANSGTGTMADPYVKQGATSQFRLESCYQFQLPDRLGISDFTSLNPLLIAWELFPYSFVVDWLVNVSKTMEAWENWFRYACYFAGGYQTQSFKTTYQANFTGSMTYTLSYWPNGTPMDGPISERMSGSSSGNTESYKNRSILTTLPTPETGIGVNVNLGSKRLLSAAALMQQAVKRSR